VTTTSVQVVEVAGIEPRQIDLPINQATQTVLEGAGKELPFHIHGQNARARVDVFVTRHSPLPRSNNYSSLDIPYGSRQDARMERLFLRFRWASAAGNVRTQTLRAFSKDEMNGILAKMA
jgi:hypothetical protein